MSSPYCCTQTYSLYTSCTSTPVKLLNSPSWYLYKRSLCTATYELSYCYTCTFNTAAQTLPHAVHQLLILLYVNSCTVVVELPKTVVLYIYSPSCYTRLFSFIRLLTVNLIVYIRAFSWYTIDTININPAFIGAVEKS
jgi:Na+-translocating ferredoxin:NAD+ oxidoreductase RnfE subunit